MPLPKCWQRFFEGGTHPRKNQGGFYPGRTCLGQNFTLCRILKRRFRYEQPLIACFIECRATFDSTDRNALWKLMLCDGAPEKLVQLSRARVRAYGEETREVDLYSKIRQGGPLSPILFNYVIDWIMSRV